MTYFTSIEFMEKLNGKHYHVWELRVRMLLAEWDLLDVLNTSKPER
jgi:hypothetical protein